MDYSQFLNMKEELYLLVVILFTFIADLCTCGRLEANEAGREGGRSVLALQPSASQLAFRVYFPVVLLAVYSATLVYTALLGGTSYEAFGGMYAHTPMMSVVKAVLAVGTTIVLLMAVPVLGRRENLVKQGEFHLLVLFTLLGMFFMISSGHFLMFFIGLELASIPLTALVAFDKECGKSAEAGAKFILLALFSSALLLYGISLLYGATGTLYFSAFADALTASPLCLLGLLLFITGMGFKISLVPFHLWTADTYEGAPTVVTGFLSVISKGSAAFVLMTVLMKVFSAAGLVEAWNTVFFWIIILSITVANLFAIRQQNLKRFMAFSAISQAGYLVLGVMDGTAQGMTALVFYLLVYMAANLGAFVVISALEEKTGALTIDSYNGLYTTNPRLAFAMTLCLFSLAGIPPFAGFFSKFFIFMAAFNAGFHLLVFIALVNTVISLYYYLLIVKAMYIQPYADGTQPMRSSWPVRVALLLCLAGVIGFGICGAFYEQIDLFSYGLR